MFNPAALSLSKGDLLDIAMPGGGCGTYAASEQAFFPLWKCHRLGSEGRGNHQLEAVAPRLLAEHNTRRGHVTFPRRWGRITAVAPGWKHPLSLRQKGADSPWRFFVFE